MALDKLYYVYGLDTACFYTDEENEIEKKLIKARHLKSLMKKKYPNTESLKNTRKINTWHFLNTYIKTKKSELKDILHKNVSITRSVRDDKVLDKDGNPSLRRRVSIFDSALTRYFGLKEREFNTEIIIVKVYFFDVAESIVKNGFYMNGYKYKFFSASAGQIRTKKLVAVREDLLNEYWNSLTAGLTIEHINECGGMNINKFLAYLALCNSATTLWKDFNIDDCIVVNDFENVINGTVDYIDDNTYNIERLTKDLPFTQTDGCGMILPELTNQNFMVRLPWVKGLLAKFDFVKFIKENNASGIVTDIYGKEHNIIEENIKIIFTKSQLKMWKFFNDWDEYKENFKKYHCTAGICNREEDEIPDSVINYQMIQTLSDMTDEEIKILAKNNVDDIRNMTSDTSTMLKVFGVTEWNHDKTGFQKCLELYPELLSDLYCRKTLKEIKTKLEKDLYSARFDMGGKYTFTVPDLYAFCEWLFLGIENPVGLLKDGEVCCKLYKNGEELDCLRSPHLYLEHPIRTNKTDIEWFDTKAIYVSCHDLISRIVQCDWDGDKLLVTNNKTLINAAKRNMKGIVPLFYDMKKAGAELIMPDNLFKGLLLAYNGGNIGSPSNDITKIWNSGNMDEERFKVIKWLVAEVNYTIDYAKTLYKPVRPDEIDNIIKKYTNSKVPYFFIYAKDKKTNQVENISDCVVDRISKLFPKKRVNFNFKNKNIGNFDYTVLMKNPDIKVSPDVIATYKKTVRELNFNNVDDKKDYNYFVVYDKANETILNFPYPKSDIIDMIIKEIFFTHRTEKKKAFWNMFGDDVFLNISTNMPDNMAYCPRCHKRYYKSHANQKYCPKCQGYIKKRTKIITCCDCGTEFEVCSLSRRIRCSNCYREERKRIDRWQKRKQRE